MSAFDVLKRVVTEVKDFLEWASFVFGDPATRRAVFQDAGHPNVKDEGKTLEFPDNAAHFAGINGYLESVNPDREAFKSALADSRAVWRIIENAYTTADSGEQIPQTIVDGVLQLALLNYVFRRWPVVYWIGQPLGYSFDLATTDPLLEKFGKGFVDFFKDKPEGRPLEKDWLALVGTALTALFEFGIDEDTASRFRLVYGWEPGPGSPTPIGDELLKRALSVQYTFDKKSTSPLGGSLTVSAISIPHGEEPAGTLLAFSGAAKFEREIAGWLLKVEVTGADAVDFFLRRDGQVISGGPENGRVTISWERKREPSGEPWVLPIRGKTRLEFGQLVASLGFSRAGFEARLVAQKSALIIESGDDELLKRGLKSGNVRTEFDLGLGYANGRPFIDGAVSLQATLPAQKAIGPVEIRSVTLGLRAGDQPDKPDQHDLTLETSVTLVIKLGPVTLVLDRIGCSGIIDFGSGDKDAGIDFDFKQPSGIGLKIEADSISGGGYIFRDPHIDQYAGVVELKINQKIEVKAIALLTRKIENKPAFSLLLIITAEGFRPWDLGMGFRITGIGGIFGVDRSINPEALEAGVKTGALDALLFPKDPIGDAPRIVSTAGAVFPPTLDRNLFGAMVRIVWGTDKLVTIDLAVVLEFAGLSVRRIAILGKVRTAFPKPDKPVVQINLDLVGTIDRDRKRAFAHLAITVGKIGIFKISGEAAMLYTWGDRPNYVISVGGFNPRFQKPENFPALERVKFSLAKKSGLTVDATFYVAVTSNSFQIGGSLDLVAKKSKFTLKGGIGIDALIQSQQPCYAFDLRASLELLMFGEPLFAVRLNGSLVGDKPWTISGKATFEIWIFDYTVDFCHTWGETEEEAPPTTTDVGPVLLIALGDRRNWTVDLPSGIKNPVVLRRVPENEPHLNPLGSLVVTQRVAPFGLPMTRNGNSRLSGQKEFRLERVSIAGTPVPTDPVMEPFAPAQFVDMSDDEKLGSPAFENMQAGVRSQAAPLASGTPVETDASYLTSIYNPVTKKAERPAEPAATLGGTVFPIYRAHFRFAAPSRKQAVRVAQPAWSLAGIDTPAPAADATRTTFAGSLATLHAQTHKRPNRRAQLQLLRTTR